MTEAEQADAGQPAQLNHIELAAEIVESYVANNAVPVSELAGLIATIHTSLVGLGSNVKADVVEAVEKATPAQIRKSITDDALISFEDGKPYKTLKRHLTSRSLSPEAYRAKHGLPLDYPMTAPGYSAQRSKLALSIGLGQVRQKAEPKAAEVAETVTDTPKARGGRRKVPASASAPKTRGRASKAIAAAE